MQMKKKSVLFSLMIGAICLVIVATPTYADTIKQVFNEVVVFKQKIDVRDGIHNKKGPVRVKDNLKVKGNLTVNGKFNGEVTAQDVNVSRGITTASDTESINLQTAIDEEIAIDIAEMVKGKTWDITNTTTDNDYENTTGQVTFSDDGTTFTLNSGSLAAIGAIAENSESVYCTGGARQTGTITYQMFGPNTMYITWTNVEQDSIGNVVDAQTNNLSQLVLVGQGGCGQISTERISTLTLVE